MGLRERVYRERDLGKGRGACEYPSGDNVDGQGETAKGKAVRGGTGFPPPGTVLCAGTGARSDAHSLAVLRSLSCLLGMTQVPPRNAGSSARRSEG